MNGLAERAVDDNDRGSGGADDNDQPRRAAFLRDLSATDTSAGPPSLHSSYFIDDASSCASTSARWRFDDWFDRLQDSFNRSARMVVSREVDPDFVDGFLAHEALTTTDATKTRFQRLRALATKSKKHVAKITPSGSASSSTQANRRSTAWQS
mmetsp:Transcript_39451/g.99260  ORF Transcript_39451/g.99260 Transcript_39451/m.99260 type:complete len:153 (-) Transcript_39451:277-735(-)